LYNSEGIVSLESLPQAEGLFPHSDHQALKFFNGQPKPNARHAKWVEFLQAFTFSIRHKKGNENVKVDALSRRYALISALGAKLLGLQTM